MTTIADKPLTYIEPSEVNAVRVTSEPAYHPSASGYGGKIPMRYKVQLVGHGRWYRVYCMIYGNSGSLYIVRGGVDCFLSRVEYMLDDARDARDAQKVG